MAVTKTCEHCGKEFTIKSSHAETRRFCSFACYKGFEKIHGRESRKVEMVEFSCKTCGKAFHRQPGTLRSYVKKFGRPPLYCSMPCSDIGRKQDSEAALVTNCVVCGTPIIGPRKPSGGMSPKRKLCSTACRATFRRTSYQQKNSAQEPTRRIGRWGYVRLLIPGKNGEPSRDVLEHRYVMEQVLGRELRKEETVHHINGVRTDNRPDNLRLFTSNHGPGQEVDDQVRWAIEILELYPEFAARAGARLVKTGEQPSDPLGSHAESVSDILVGVLSELA